MEQVGFEPTTFRRITGLQPAKQPIAQLLHYLVDADRVERSQTYLCAGRLQLLELANAQHVHIFGIARGNRTPVLRRYLERVMTVTSSQLAIELFGGYGRIRTYKYSEEERGYSPPSSQLLNVSKLFGGSPQSRTEFLLRDTGLQPAAVTNAARDPFLLLSKSSKFTFITTVNEINYYDF